MFVYSDPRATKVENPPVALVYGHATVYDSDLQANTDRYLQTFLPRSKGFNNMPRFMLKWLRSSLIRIWIAVTPLKILWWPDANMEESPKEWRAPNGTQAPPSDPKPEPLSTPHKPWMDSASDWHKDMAYAFKDLGLPILTVVDEEGYPVPFRVKRGSLQSDGVRLELSPATPTDARGRACLTFHTLEVKNGEMLSYDNKTFIGTLSDDGDFFTVTRQLGSHDMSSDLRGVLWYIRSSLRLEKRIDVEVDEGNLFPKLGFLDIAINALVYGTY